MARFRRTHSELSAPLSALTEEAASDDAHGAVARGLVEAQKLGLPVAPSWVLSASVFRHTVRVELPPAHDPSALLRVIDRPRGLEQAGRAHRRLSELTFDKRLSGELDSLWTLVAAQKPSLVFVSSSPTLADYEVCRSAGLLRTIHDVRDVVGLTRALRVLWASATHEGILLYLRARRIKDLAIAVVVQAISKPRTTGLLVTQIDPPEARGLAQPTRLLAARRGLPNAKSIGSAPWKEVMRLDARGNIVEEIRGRQPEQCVPGSDGLAFTAIADEEPAISAPALKRLDEIARLADVAGARRIDFIIDDEDVVHVTSFAPIAGAGYPLGGHESTRWARSACADPWPGRLAPLGQRLAVEWARESMRRALTVRRAGSLTPHSVVRFRGRCYVNLSTLLDTPNGTLEYDDASLAELAGAQVDGNASTSAIARASLARSGIALARLSADQRRLAEAVERFERDAEQQRRWLAELDLAILPDDALKTTLREGRSFFADGARLSIDAMAALTQHQALLRALLNRAGHPSSLAYAICAGVGDLESAKPAIAFGHVLAIAWRDRQTMSRLREGPLDLETLPEGPTRRALRQLLDAFGDQSINDLELSQSRWSEDPSFLLRLLEQGLSSEPPDADVVLSRTRAEADRQLALLEARLSYMQTRLLRELVARQRQYVRLAARLRTRVTHALNMLRTIALEVDRRLRRLDRTLPQGAAFYCTFDELVEAVGNYRADLEPIVFLRAAEWEQDRTATEPGPFFRGKPRPWEPFTGPLSRVRGLSAGAGSVTGIARCLGPQLEGLSRFKPGDVAVVPALDAALGPLFLLSSAIVAEVGNPMSAGAVVARELGVPAVTGVASACSRLVDGERVRVDADQGIVERLSS